MGVLPPFPNFPLFPSFYSTLRQYRVTLSCWESGLLSSPISLFHFQSKSGTLPFPLKGYGPTALILIEDLHAVAVTNTTDLQTVRNDINVLRTNLNSITQDMRKLNKLMVSMNLCMQNLMHSMIKYGVHADNGASESKLTEAVACLSDAELSEI